jgi:DNA-binding NtrC family response regulator
MVRRLGSNRWIPVDVQVVAASNRDLRSEIKAGRFREDLYHRLSLFQFHLPPLRERRGDIPLLVTHFARRYANHPIKFSQDALELLIQHSWPGNVRELENVMRAAISHAADGMIYAVDLLPHLQGGSEIKATCSVCSGVTASASEVTVTASPTSFDAQVKEFKLKTVKEALRQHRGNITHTAAALGMTRPTLYKLLKELESGN